MPHADMIAQTSLPRDPGAMRIEQRRDPRYTLLLRQAKLRTKSGEFLCVIRDVSTTGISIRTFHPLPASERMAIELREGCPYLVEKVWEQEGEAGFRFRDPVALGQMLEDDARYPRRPIRIKVELPVEVVATGERGSGQITNLSQQGARLEADRSWARDQLLRLGIDGLPPVYAKVRWRRETVHGLVLEETFSFRDFAWCLARLHRLV
ncbi:PilZ domain-containing protein [Parerythrobacter aurantius]|uniref:PilZ domain-containing protein n=1 Tax=Parerythrobacter aurantius TaxID=3127706 RepID=UPI003247A4D8